MYREGVRFKFTLIHPTEGSEVIDEPVDWDKAEFTLKRDASFHSILFEFTSPLRFYFRNSARNGGAEFISFIRKKYGPDGKLYLKVETSHHTQEEYEQVYYGRLELIDYEETERYITCNISQDDFFTTFNQRLSLPVSFKDNISVDGIALQEYFPSEVELHSKVLVKRTEVDINNPEGVSLPAFPTHNFVIHKGPPGAPDPEQTGINDQPDTQFEERTSFIQFDLSAVTNEELEDFWGVSAGVVPTLEQIPEIYTAKEAGLHEFDIHLDFEIPVEARSLRFFTAFLVCGGKRQINGLVRVAEAQIIFEIQDKDGNVKFTSIHHIDNVIDNCSTKKTTIPGTANFKPEEKDLAVGDKVFLYASVYMNGNYEKIVQHDTEVEYSVGIKMKPGSYLKIKGKTFTEGSTGIGFRVHDLLQNLINKITNRNDSFHSDCFGYLGAPYHSYEEKGCYADFVIMDGFGLRGFPWEQRSLQPMFNKIFDSLNAIFSLGLGLEVIDGVEKIRIEPLSYFYNKEPVLTFDNIRGIKRRYDKEKFYNQIEIGYEQWQPEEINGLDEFNTKQTWATDLQTIGQPLVLRSEVIASGSLIEVTRRAQFDESLTTDTRYDTEFFIIAVAKDEPLRSEKNENFEWVSNVLSPETAYNLRISPKRCLLRHGNRINGGLLTKLGSTYKFMAGEGNYKLSTELKEDCPGSFNGEFLIENEDVPWGYAEVPEVDPLWSPEVVNFKYPLGLDDFATLKLNKNNCIAISGDIYEEGVFQKVFVLEAKKNPNHGLVEITGLVVNDLPFNYVPEEADHLLLQSGFDFLFENGDLMLIN